MAASSRWKVRLERAQHSLSMCRLASRFVPRGTVTITRMKRILVIDESEVVRETLALILGREFAVSKRPLGTKGLPLSDIREEFDLLILGISPHYGLEAASLVRFAAQLPFTVLFLVDSKSTARVIEDEAQVGCLT